MDYRFVERQVHKPIEVKKAMESKEILQDRLREAYEQNEEFQSHKFVNIFGNEREDSEYMKNVKTAQANVIDFFQNTRMSADENAYNAQLATIKHLYSVLIAHCATYGAHHRAAISSSGKTRRRMVNQIKKLAEYELEKIDETAAKIHQTQDETTDWSSVLGEMRSARIDMDTHSFEATGGGTSDVKAISFGENKSKFFFKKEEKLTSVTEETRQEIMSRPEFAKHQGVLLRICDKIDPDDAYSPFRIAVQGYEEWNTFKNMASGTIQFTQQESDELEKIMPTFRKVFKKIHTKYGITKEAGIERGSDLTGRNIATSRMANFLGKSRLVTEAARVQLTSGDTVTEEGVVTRQAEGNQIDDLVKLSKEKNKKIVLDPAAARDLINLEIMDTLCGQLDRNKSNLFFQHEETEDEIRLTHVTGIDSDMSFGTVKYEELQKYADGFHQLPQIEQKDGVSRVPVIDADMADSIMALTRENLEYLLSDLLSEADIEALWKRAQGLQKMLINNKDKIKAGEWSTDDVNATRNAGSYLDKIKDLIPLQ